jgi:hypothetical protein
LKNLGKRCALRPRHHEEHPRRAVLLPRGLTMPDDEVEAFEDSVDGLVWLILAVVVLSLCGWCLSAELRQARDAEEWFKKQKTMNGLASSPDRPIELIGGRPDNERPAGVDWTISMWSGVRGEYGPSDRGYRPVSKVKPGR